MPISRDIIPMYNRVCPTFYTSEKISRKDTKTQRNHKETS
ncbi:Uncharacterized protein dnm_088970 [Desulfonema magnum]|uniref:Uncharacterized protein n=1 Tax=Desulfonema magnum TaxID=45655 RepID=A0A975GT71_9BACT|nr:Uncharacterized protein dnm_088970 [Desulfonema magnum]